MGSNSITYAIYNPLWKYGTDHRLLTIGSKNVVPEDYEPYMRGAIYCPKCFTPLSRNPAFKSLSKNAKTAHYRHLPSFKDVPCPYHTTQQRGINYVNEEITNQADDDPQFKRVKEWAKLPPEQYMSDDRRALYNGINHDPHGEISEVAIPRHHGQTLKHPSKIQTVQYICANLDGLLNSAFSLPHIKATLPLKDLLYNAKLIRHNIGDAPQLFYGKITGFHSQIFRNRTRIQTGEHRFLSLYTKDEYDRRKSIDSQCIGRYMMFFGSVQWEDNNKPFIMLDDWGTYAVIPQKYNTQLKKITSFELG